MNNIDKLKRLVDNFAANLSYYKNMKNAYNEHQCRIEYIDPLLKLIGWDVRNQKRLAPQFREVIAEDYLENTGRPDYSLTLRGVTKFFIEAKKPSVDIYNIPDPALQARKYGWNARHTITILTNFEYLIIYDTTFVPKPGDSCSVARFRTYHFSEYVTKFNEIFYLISRESVYSGDFDSNFGQNFHVTGSQKVQVDDLFLSQINQWRVSLSNELYSKQKKYQSLDVLNDVVQEFINQIVFLRICEDKNLPLYHKLKETIDDSAQIPAKLEELFRASDRRYNSGMFSGDSIIFDINSNVIIDIIKDLYYPQSPYLFNIIEPNMLGKIYEMFLTEQLVLLEDGSIALSKKKDCANRSVVTTPIEIVKYMVEKTMVLACSEKTPTDLLSLRIADIACGSGIYLEEVFAYLQSFCIEWYLIHDKNHLIEIGNGRYKLPLEEKKDLLCSCIYGIDIDIHAVEVAKFSLLIKLIEDETTPSVASVMPILPDLSHNIFHGNSLVSNEELDVQCDETRLLMDLVPFNWEDINCGGHFDVIIGNPPYVNTEEMHQLLPALELDIYKKRYISSYKQFDKYFIFLERAIQKIKEGGYICYIVPNKFFKVASGEKIRELISDRKLLISLDDFGDTQLFEDKTTYSSIILLQKREQSEFSYSSVKSVNKLWAGEEVSTIRLNISTLNKLPWRLTTDLVFLSMLKKIDEVSVPLNKYVNIFNGIQTSAERPTPIYWFSIEDIDGELENTIQIKRNGIVYNIEKNILKPYFKPTKQTEKRLNSYSFLKTDKYIIFPYNENGQLIPIDVMKKDYPGTYEYLASHYERLVPKGVSLNGIRDVPNATYETWYQYGRTQALTAFIKTPKLIVGILSKDPMYIYDNNDMLIASGGTAGYCAISKKTESKYELEYIQAWLSNPYTESILKTTGSDFENGFFARGTFILQNLPFIELDFKVPEQKNIYEKVVAKTRNIYRINTTLDGHHSKSFESVMLRKKMHLMAEIEALIAKVYRLEF